MKTFKLILVVLSLAMAMSVTSCGDGLRGDIFVVGFPESFGDGEEFQFSFTVRADFPFSDIDFSYPEWVSVSAKNGVVDVVVSENRTLEPRTGYFILEDTKGKGRCVYGATQGARIVNRVDAVQFTDAAFKAAVLEVADANGDGDIDNAEAEAIEELELVGKGIRDLTGLDAFKNVWKLDLRDNNIEDAMIVTNLHRLHWLNLKGNENLKCFDVRGCTSYFEVCDYDVTKNLNYYLFYRQIGITLADDQNDKHSHHSLDPRETQDWSREGEFIQVQKHTKGPGKVGLVFSGMGWIDVDVNDGTFERIMRETMDKLSKRPGWAQNWEYFDVYIFVHMAERRSQWMYDPDKYSLSDSEVSEKVDAFRSHRDLLWKQEQVCITNKYCYSFHVDSHLDPGSPFLCTDYGSITTIRNFASSCIAPVFRLDCKMENSNLEKNIDFALSFNQFTLKDDVDWRNHEYGEAKYLPWDDWKSE